MPTSLPDTADAAGVVAQSVQQSARLQEAQLRGLEALSRLLLQAGQENIALHRKTLDALRTMRLDMERLGRALRTLSTSRT